MPGRLTLYECPRSYISRNTVEIKAIVYRIKNTGRLWQLGELADQPHWLIEACDMFESEQVRAAKIKAAAAKEGNRL